MALRSDISNVDWGVLHTPYGSAEQIPQLIIGLTSANDEFRQQSFARLKGAIYHQGDVGDVTAHVVPFLIEIVGDRDAKGKAALLSLLAVLASVINNEKLRRQTNEPPEWERALAEAGYGRDGAQSRLYEEQTYAAVQHGLPVYLGLFGDPDRSVRVSVARLLSHFVPSAPSIIPRLAHQLTLEQDPRVQLAIVECLGKLIAGDTTRSRDEKAASIAILRQHTQSPDRDVALFAAIALARIGGDAFNGEIIDILLAAVAPPRWETAIQTVCDALCKLDVPRGLDAFEQVLQTVTKREDAQFAANALLGFVIEGKTSADADYLTEGFHHSEPHAPLDPQQDRFLRRALAALLRCEPFWSTPRPILERYGLPGQRADLQQMVEAPAAPDAGPA